MESESCLSLIVTYTYLHSFLFKVSNLKDVYFGSMGILMVDKIIILEIPHCPEDFWFQSTKLNLSCRLYKEND